MDKRKIVLVMIATTGLMVWMGGGASAQDDQGNPAPAVQVQGADQGQGPGQMRRGYPGYRLRKLDEMPQASKEKTNKIRLVVEDERKQMKALGEDRSLTKEQKKEKALQIREDAQNKLKALLPPEEWKRREESQAKARQLREAIRTKKAENLSSTGK